MCQKNGRRKVEMNMEGNENRPLKRRTFLAGAAAAIGTSALSYARIAGANDRISLGHIGVGQRGGQLASIVAGLKDSTAWK